MTDPAQLGAEMLATLSNAILKLDPLSEVKIRELEGRSIRLDVQLPGRGEPTRWLMTFSKDSVQLAPCAEATAHAIVRGEPGDLLAWLAGGRSGDLRFDGDIGLLDSVSGLMKGYEPDLAPPLGKMIGNDAASALVGFVEAAGAAARTALQTLGGAAEETAHAHYTTPDELTQATRKLEDMALKVDRLKARTDRLEALQSTAPVGNPE